jgi:aryl-alcohol dehydrogenase-like predicted oxidoreductase
MTDADGLAWTRRRFLAGGVAAAAAALAGRSSRARSPADERSAARITKAIPGTTKVAHLEDNQAAGHGRLPDADLRRRMESLWDAL